MTRTRLLLALLVLVVLLQLFPDRAGPIKLVAVCAGTVYFAAVMGAKYRARRRESLARAAQEAADEAEYRRYRSELDAIRARHDPHRDLGDPTSISADYRDELSALHDRHQEMLNRKFGARS
jgi:hypothetical protein